MVPLFWADLEGAPLAVRIPVVVIVVLGILTMQVTAICVWRLLTMVRRGTVFSHSAFRYVDIVIGSIAAASLLTLWLGVVLAPGEAVPPGMVLLIGGVGLVVAGIALIVLVLRMLLAQAQDVRGRTRGTRRDHARQPRGAQERTRQGGAVHDAVPLCEALECQPGDLLRWEPGEPTTQSNADSHRSPQR